MWAKPSAKPIVLTVSPNANANNVSPSQQVVVNAEGGTLKSVSVTSGGKALDGAMDADGKTWRSSGALGYAATYTVTASLTDSLGAPVEKTSTFTTMKPTKTLSVNFQANALTSMKTGGTYGVGQIIAIRFSKEVTDKAAAEKAVVIQTSPSVEGKFFWLDKQTLHWRPEKYWAKGTKVNVAVNAVGVDFGGGVFGTSNISTHFSIGRSLIAKADNNAHYTKVYVDGALVRNMACSMGKGGYTTGSDGKQIHFWTQNGVHVVLNRAMNVEMDSASYGVTDKSNPNYYDENVTLCTRISYSGEFLHAAPWNMADHGKRNSSHGCINLSTADAQWVYDTFIEGDVVEVSNSPKPIPVWDGLGDWNASWDTY
ncbi:Ig-like domain-containing protein [Rugosimonospora acidiphila]|uniref:Ig-like domain-containing protein n=1 Tax=Rugosimonospora acidiphila TaxID=556531 RepID=A0ABP9RQF7_9ACTN